MEHGSFLLVKNECRLHASDVHTSTRLSYVWPQHQWVPVYQYACMNWKIYNGDNGNWFESNFALPSDIGIRITRPLCTWYSTSKATSPAAVQSIYIQYYTYHTTVGTWYQVPLPTLSSILQLADHFVSPICLRRIAHRIALNYLLSTSNNAGRGDREPWD